MIPKKRVLITGGAGFIGCALAQTLCERPSYHLTLLDNLQRGRRDDALEDLIRLPNVEWISADLTDPRTFLSLKRDFDYIYHFAAILGVRTVLENPDKVLSVNAISTLNLYEYARSLPHLKKILFASTSEIYSGTQKHFGIPVPTPENIPLALADVTSARTTYALSKMYGESIAHVWGQKHAIPSTIVRYHNVYGPRMGFMHVIPEMFLKIETAKSIEVPSADHTRAFCFVADAVRLTIEACEAEATRGETLNVGNQSEEVSISDLVKVIARVMGKNISIHAVSPTLGSPPRRCPDMSVAEKLFGYRAQYTLEEGIQETYSWYKPRLETR